MIRQTSTTRRGVLLSIGAGGLAAVAGCLDDGIGVNGDPTYERGEVPDLDADERTAEELSAAEALAEREIHEGVTALDPLAIADHEFVLEDDFRGPTVQGTVENAGDDRIEVVEVRVRVYGEDGEQLGRYLDSTGDLDGDSSWGFQVVLLESPAEISDYDVAVLGTPT